MKMRCLSYIVLGAKTFISILCLTACQGPNKRYSLEQWPEMRNTTEAAVQEAYHFPWFGDLEPIYSALSTCVEVENSNDNRSSFFFNAGLPTEVNGYHVLHCRSATWWVLIPSSVCNFGYDLSVAEPTRLLERWDNACTAEKTHAVICGERVCNNA